jgi:hypothetical protein
MTQNKVQLERSKILRKRMGNQVVSEISQAGTGPEYPDKYRGIHLLKFISHNVIIEKSVLKTIQNPRKSVKPIYEPPTEAGHEHPTNWLWHHDEWDCFTDENGYTYYFNNLTGESTWNPPETLRLLYNLDTYMAEQPILEPPSCEPQADVTTDMTDKGVLEEENLLQLALAGDDDKEGLKSIPSTNNHTIEFMETDSLVEPLNSQDMWVLFATYSSVPLDTLTSRLNEAMDILSQVSEGSYNANNLILVSWAYKFHQFKGILYFITTIFTYILKYIICIYTVDIHTLYCTCILYTVYIYIYF